MKKSEILREAKRRLLTGAEARKEMKSKYLNVSHKRVNICGALFDAVNESNTRSNADIIKRESLQNWVMHLLDGATTYVGWVARKHEHLLSAARTPSHRHVLIQSARHRWIDWMIQHWEERERGEDKRGRHWR
jgi:hypothetical protein